MAAQIKEIAAAVENGASRNDLLTLLPPGGARCAVDAALWDLEAKNGTPAWRLAGLQNAPSKVVTAFTITLDRPDAMEEAARRASAHPLLKVKIGGGDGLDTERVARVRRAAPAARLVADGNEGCDNETLEELAQTMAEHGYELLEQPLPAGEESRLTGRRFAVRLCTDESLFTAADVAGLKGVYRYGNIKLDKTGGLTEALRLADALEMAGMKIFLGCMISPALSLAPSLLLAGRAAVVDLDGSLWLEDDPNGMSVNEAGELNPLLAGVWGEC
jgi:L-alanine-DL-glutamate epimerase-like enolase superfamily enzyme